MSNFLLIVQTGLLMHVSMSKRMTTVAYDGHKPDPIKETLLNAMVDAVFLENMSLKHDSLLNDRKLGSQEAIDFVKWAVYGTDYHWIKNILGERKKCSY